MEGLIFDIKEFALNDGAGIRTTVFFKGCPLRCIWCHNPEGLSKKPELYVKENGCTGCGLCKIPCEHEDCKPYGRCLHICKCDLVTVAGKYMSIEELRAKLLRGKDIFNSTGGGITLSGGEPLLQADFVYELLKSLKGEVHRAIETSGFADFDVFKKICAECDFVFMDIKLADDALHQKFTGVSNKKILNNAKWLIESGIPHTFRLPLIPGITDTDENLRAVSSIVGTDEIELLPYNTLAPAKYKSAGREFTKEIDINKKREVDLSIFKNAKIRR